MLDSFQWLIVLGFVSILPAAEIVSIPYPYDLGTQKQEGSVASDSGGLLFHTWDPLDVAMYNRFPSGDTATCQTSGEISNVAN